MSTVLNIRGDDALKRAFVEAAERADPIAPEVLRSIMTASVRDGRSGGAHRQSLAVAASAGEQETLVFIAGVQEIEDTQDLDDV